MFKITCDICERADDVFPDGVVELDNDQNPILPEGWTRQQYSGNFVCPDCLEELKPSA